MVVVGGAKREEERKGEGVGDDECESDRLKKPPMAGTFGMLLRANKQWGLFLGFTYDR